MNALDHFRKGEALLAESQRTPAEALRDESIPTAALLVDQARALDMPAHDYEAWEKHVLASKAPAVTAREFEDVDDSEEETPSCAECGVDAVIRGGVWAHAAPTVGEHAVVLEPRVSANGGEGRG